MKKYLFPILLALGLVAFLPQRAKAGGYFGISVGPVITTLIPCTTGAIVRPTIANIITMIIRTGTGTGVITVIGITTMMIKPRSHHDGVESYDSIELFVAVARRRRARAAPIDLDRSVVSRK